MAEPTLFLPQAQSRVLRYCAFRRRWVALAELGAAIDLEPEDVLTVPSLVSRRLLLQTESLSLVRTTGLGEHYARR